MQMTWTADEPGDDVHNSERPSLSWVAVEGGLQSTSEEICADPSCSGAELQKEWPTSHLHHF